MTLSGRIFQLSRAGRPAEVPFRASARLAPDQRSGASFQEPAALRLTILVKNGQSTYGGFMRASATRMRTLTISLSHRQVKRIQEAVDSGTYASNSEVVRDALRLWEQREEQRAVDLDRLKRADDEAERNPAKGRSNPD
ncbi:type II toxin-antitoxin system ParD family antitoxin [Rhodoplanes sp. SY1]|uniref:ribbon-helix-helix domain-containing protein n=1 Tax=Rhodoplanes sp. SY1 TaxID=3166646 RepID=UPI0038B65512